MPSPRILILAESGTAKRWSVASHAPRRSATVYAERKRDAQLLGAQLLGVAPDKCIAVDSPAFLESLQLA